MTHDPLCLTNTCVEGCCQCDLIQRARRDQVSLDLVSKASRDQARRDQASRAFANGYRQGYLDAVVGKPPIHGSPSAESATGS